VEDKTTVKVIISLPSCHDSGLNWFELPTHRLKVHHSVICQQQHKTEFKELQLYLQMIHTYLHL